MSPEIETVGDALNILRDTEGDEMLEWIMENITVRVYGDIEDPQVEVDWK